MREQKKPNKGYFTELGLDIIKYKYIYIMLIPVLLYYIIFHYIPMGGAVIAFQDFKPAKGFLNSDWVGFKHFIDFLTGIYAPRVIINTILLNLLNLIFGFPAPIILALMLNEVSNKSFKKITQTISYMPHFISMVVVCGMVITFVKSDGIITQFLTLFGMEEVNLLSKKEYFRTIFVSTSIWKALGWGSIIYLATLSGVDPNLYEAATIDGAGRFKKIIHVTLPALIPVITIQLILRMGRMLTQGFEQVMLLYNPLIYDTADIISTYVYRRGLEDMDYSFASAVGIFNSVINLILLFSANWFSRKFVKESLW